MTTKIDRREDVSPKEGAREYGDVAFADPVNKKYPIDTEEHVRAAWSYITSMQPKSVIRCPWQPTNRAEPVNPMNRPG